MLGYFSRQTCHLVSIPKGKVAIKLRDRSWISTVRSKNMILGQVLKTQYSAIKYWLYR